MLFEKSGFLRQKAPKTSKMAQNGEAVQNSERDESSDSKNPDFFENGRKLSQNGFWRKIRDIPAESGQNRPIYPEIAPDDVKIGFSTSKSPFWYLRHPVRPKRRRNRPDLALDRPRRRQNRLRHVKISILVAETSRETQTASSYGHFWVAFCVFSFFWTSRVKLFTSVARRGLGLPGRLGHHSDAQSVYFLFLVQLAPVGVSQELLGRRPRSLSDVPGAPIFYFVWIRCKKDSTSF